MTAATITLTDCEQGLDMRAEYIGGFNPLSPAHQHIEVLIKMLGELAQPLGEPVHLNAEELAAFRADPLANFPQAAQG